MQEDFHYYATYCAAYIAGYSHEESMAICYSAQFVDLCTATLLSKIKAPKEAATTQLNLELMDTRPDILGLQDITRIWSSFHFLPYDLYAVKKKRSKKYMHKYRMICNSNGALVAKTVELAKDKSLQAVGVAMHVLADTWAHRYFAGTPSLVINNTNEFFYEILSTEEGDRERKIVFKHSTSFTDDIENATYVSSLYQYSENSIMNLGHGRAGHLPDYSFIRYKYLPAWNDYEEIVKDNPSDYMHAFCQMIYAMQYLRGERESFELNQYAVDAIAPWKDEIEAIIRKRQLDACADWKAFGEKLSGCEITSFDPERYQADYVESEDKNDTFLGKFIVAAMSQKSMVTNQVHRSGNPLAGFSVNYDEVKGFRGIKAYSLLLGTAKGVADHEES